MPDFDATVCPVRLLVGGVGNRGIRAVADANDPVTLHTELLEQGGHGVFLLAAAQCREYQRLFRSRLKG